MANAFVPVDVGPRPRSQMLVSSVKFGSYAEVSSRAVLCGARQRRSFERIRKIEIADSPRSPASGAIEKYEARCSSALDPWDTGQEAVFATSKRSTFVSFWCDT